MILSDSMMKRLRLRKFEITPHFYPIIFLMSTPARKDVLLPPEIQKTLEETAHELRRGEILRPILALTLGTLVFFWLAVLTEHWLLCGGIPGWTRGGLWLAAVGTWIFVFYRRILPFLRWKINPLHTANVIESAQPSLKNGLLNLLSLARDENPEAELTSLERRVLKVLERQTAANLSEVQPENVVSRAASRKLLLAILIVTFCFTLYGILSPKSTFRSIGRTLFPWCEISVPTRVRIREITPGDASLYSGGTLRVRARITHLRKGETPCVLYSSADKKYVNAPVPMWNERENDAESEIAGTNGTAAAGSEKNSGESAGKTQAADSEEAGNENGAKKHSGEYWTAEIRESEAGIQQNLTWKIAAGDAFSREFRLTVLPPLSVSVREITLTPPPYSKLAPVRQKTGDIRTLNGTQAELHVQTSEASKETFLRVTSRRTNRVKIIRMAPDVKDGKASQTHFHAAVPLETVFLGGIGMNSERSEMFSVQMFFRNIQGEESRKPLVFTWEIQADSGPEVHLTAAPEDGEGRKAAECAEISFEASDPDFGLRAAAVCVSWKGKRLHIPPVLNLPEGREGLKVPFSGTFTFIPEAWGLQAGDEVLWWVEAADTCKPAANRASTAVRTLRVLGENEEISDGEKTGEEQTETLESSEMSEESDGTETAFPVSADFPQVSENEIKPGAESFMEDAQAQGETLEEEGPASAEKNSSSAETPEEGKDGENGENAENSGSGENSGTEKEAESGSKSPENSSSKSDAGKDGNTSENPGESEGTDRADGTENTKNAQGNENSGETEKSEGTEGAEGTEGVKTPADSDADAPRTSEPKLAPEGYDPLSEKEAQKEPENQDGNSQDGNTQDGNTQEEKNSEAEKSRNSEKIKDGTGENGENGENSESKKKTGQNSDSRKEPDESGNMTDSTQKLDGKKGKDGPESELSAEAEGETEEEKDSENPEDAQKEKTGKSTGSGAKTEEELPADADSAQSGTEEGSDSAQSLPDAAREKEHSDGSGLQDSDSQRPGKEKMNAEDLKNPDDAENEDGSDGSESPRLAEDGEQNGTRPDPVSDPGEAFEEILKHREKAVSTPESGMNPNREAPEGKDGGKEEPPALDAPNAAMNGENLELQKHEQGEKKEDSASTPEASGESENKEKKNPEGHSSPQDGSQQGDGGDRKSKGQIQPDNSAEAGGRAGENKGGNRSGAEEQSNQQGLGRDGSNTPNESGNPAGSGGEGPNGERGGNSALADHPTGSADPEERQGEGTSVKKGEKESQSYGNSGSSSRNSDDSTASGGSGIGENVRSPMGTQGMARSSEKEDAVNVEFARKQSVLALEHLRDALDRDDDSLLEYLGWTRDEAREFLEHWEKLNQDLEKDTLLPEQRREREETFRNLGITPRSFRYENRTQEESERPNVRSGRKIDAPQQWQEQFDAYSRGVGSGK